MAHTRRFERALVLVAAAALLAACGSRYPGSPAPMTPQDTVRVVDSAPRSGDPIVASVPGSVAPLDALEADAVPPKCKGQQTTSSYATASETLETKGGSLCIPAFKGLGGTIVYPPANPSEGITLTTSTTNYDGKLPSLGSGTPVAYIQVAIAGGTTFGSGVGAGGGLEGRQLTAGKTYTIYGQATVFGFTLTFTPCYAVAQKSKYGGRVGGFGTLLKGVNVPAAASGVLEVYPGKNAGGAC